MQFDIALLPGDYIGPEVIGEAVKVVNSVGTAYGHKFNWHEYAVGGASIQKYGMSLTPEAVALCRQSDAILFGAAGGPISPNDDALLQLRKIFDLYANLRVVKVFPALSNASTLKPRVVEGVDLIILRELTSGLYFGQPRGVTETRSGRQAFNTMFYTEAEIERVLRVGFELARARRKKLLSVDKSNVLEVSGLWRDIATRMAPEYPDVQLTHMYVDAAAMILVRQPKELDVVAMENTFGDILSDEAAMISGSLGMIPSASLSGLPHGRAFGLYEPIHGSDPANAGKDVDNPIASILSAALMLRYSFGLETEATAIEEAVGKVVKNYRTWDIMEEGMSEVGTRQMGTLIAEAVK